MLRGDLLPLLLLLPAAADVEAAGVSAMASRSGGPRAAVPAAPARQLCMLADAIEFAAAKVREAPPLMAGHVRMSNEECTSSVHFQLSKSSQVSLAASLHSEETDDCTQRTRNAAFEHPLNR